jgi:hypothetical protein
MLCQRNNPLFLTALLLLRKVENQNVTVIVNNVEQSFSGSNVTHRWVMD